MTIKGVLIWGIIIIIGLAVLNMLFKKIPKQFIQLGIFILFIIFIVFIVIGLIKLANKKYGY